MISADLPLRLFVVSKFCLYLWKLYLYVFICMHVHVYVCVLTCLYVPVSEWVCVYGHEYVCVCVWGAPWYMCLGQRTAHGIWFPFTKQVLGIKLRGQRLGARTFYTEPFHQLVCCFILKKGCKNVFCDWVDLCLGLTFAGYNLQHLFLSACYFQGQQKEGGHGFLWVSTPFLLLSFFSFSLM